MGDFLGFTFGNDHSSDLGITRVSGGDRYDEELHPEIKDRTAEVPGLNGEYYFGSDFGTKTFDIEIAFDYLTEEQFRKLRKVFGTKQIKQLIFEERPYKYYMAKLASPIELSYVCFNEPLKVETQIEGIPYREGETILTSHVVMRPDELGRTQRIYKGEGKISFVCYFPFAKSVYRYIPTNEEESDWAVSSGILSETEYNNKLINVFNNNQINVYNPGDIQTGFHLYIPFENFTQPITLRYQAKEGLTDFDILVINPPSISKIYDYQEITSLEGNPQENGWYELTNGNFVLSEDTAIAIDKTYYEALLDEGVLIDTNNGLITGVSNYADNQYTTSGNLYNECVEAGYFFKLQPNDIDDNAKIEITNGNEGIKIFYDYLYF